ncbi:MAG TPA: hypothetical protein VIJ85_00455 [Rhizomicrobium sp.]
MSAIAVPRKTLLQRPLARIALISAAAILGAMAVCYLLALLVGEANLL